MIPRSVDDNLGPYLQITLIYALEITMLMVVLSGLVPFFLIPSIFVSVVGFAVGEM